MGWMAPLRHPGARMVVDETHHQEEPSMSEVTTIGLDLAKHVFQVHRVDASGATVLRKQLRRGQVVAFFASLPRCCLVGLEACTGGGPRGPADAGAIRQGLGQAQQDRRGGCRSDLRSGGPAEHAVCRDQDSRATSRATGAPWPRKAGSAAHQPGQCAACASGRVWGDRAARVAQCCATDCHRPRRHMTSRRTGAIHT